MTFELLAGLSVSISDDAGFYMSLTGKEDSLSPYLYTIPFYANSPVKEGKVYHVTAAHSELGTATIDVAVPDPFTASVASSTNAIYASDTTLAVDLLINDQPGAHYYVVEAVKQPMIIAGSFLHNSQWLIISENRFLYDSLKAAGVTLQKQFDTSFGSTYLRQSLYTSDANSENLKNNSSFNQFRRVLLTDQKFEGSAYNTRVYLSKSRYFPDSSAERGRILLQVKSVSKDYFDYLRAYELYSPGMDYSSAGGPVSFKSPVKNGMGIVGGVYKQQFIFVLDSWEF
jgi:hypothetical protein